MLGGGADIQGEGKKNDKTDGSDSDRRKKTIKRVDSWNKHSNPICVPAQLILGHLKGKWVDG